MFGKFLIVVSTMQYSCRYIYLPYIRHIRVGEGVCWMAERLWRKSPRWRMLSNFMWYCDEHSYTRSVTSSGGIILAMLYEKWEHVGMTRTVGTRLNRFYTCSVDDATVEFRRCGGSTIFARIICGWYDLREWRRVKGDERSSQVELPV